MGWKEGKGLGKNEDGISKPLKLNVQKDAAGFGFDRNTSTINTEVWFKELDQVIVDARKKVKRKVKNVSTSGENEQTETCDGKQEMMTGNKLYKNFVASKREADNVSNSGSENEEKSSKESRKKKKGIDLNEIYQKSNGVTCHRSAHVGITMSGKMRRLQEQDEQFKKTKLDAKS